VSKRKKKADPAKLKIAKALVEFLDDVDPDALTAVLGEYVKEMCDGGLFYLNLSEASPTISFSVEAGDYEVPIEPQTDAKEFLTAAIAGQQGVKRELVRAVKLFESAAAYARQLLGDAKSAPNSDGGWTLFSPEESITIEKGQVFAINYGSFPKPDAELIIWNAGAPSTKGRHESLKFAKEQDGPVWERS